MALSISEEMTDAMAKITMTELPSWAKMTTRELENAGFTFSGGRQMGKSTAAKQVAEFKRLQAEEAAASRQLEAAVAQAELESDPNYGSW
jgi:capsule polysaccharide export protein KpsE/RkpR